MNNEPDFDMIATESISVSGSVHSSGEAYVTVERLHSKTDDVPISVTGSVHGTAHSEVEVVESVSPNTNLPTPAENARGFTSMVSGDLRHEAPSIEVGRLVIIPPDGTVVAGMYDGGYTVYDEVRLRGGVHNPAPIEVHIEDLYVFSEDEER